MKVTKELQQELTNGISGKLIEIARISKKQHMLVIKTKHNILDMLEFGKNELDDYHNEEYDNYSIGGLIIENDGKTIKLFSNSRYVERAGFKAGDDMTIANLKFGVEGEDWEDGENSGTYESTGFKTVNLKLRSEAASKRSEANSEAINQKVALIEALPRELQDRALAALFAGTVPTVNTVSSTPVVDTVDDED